MKRNYPPDVLNRIVLSTEAGNACYLNADSFEIIEVPYSIMDKNYNPTIEPYISQLKKIESDWQISIRLNPVDYIDYQNAMLKFAENEVSDPYLNENLDGFQFEKEHIMRMKSYLDEADYNIEWAKFKHEFLVDSLKQFLDFDPETTPPHQEINGFFNDDGTKIDMESIPVPGLCILCKSFYKDDWEENLLCLMNRNDQKDDDQFECGAYEKV